MKGKIQPFPIRLSEIVEFKILKSYEEGLLFDSNVLKYDVGFHVKAIADAAQYFGRRIPYPTCYFESGSTGSIGIFIQSAQVRWFFGTVHPNSVETVRALHERWQSANGAKSARV